MTSIRIRPLAPADHEWAQALNNSEVPHVSGLGADSFAALLDMAAIAAVAVADGAAAGFIVALLPGAAYGSENYRWFDAHYPGFLYIDRVIVDPACRGRGIAGTLYRHAIDFGRGRADILTCEVNETPPNPGSLRFHERLGFRPLGRQETEDGAKSVVMLGLDLAAR
jgi:predicted GNAT superfamily acetyltransferase